MTQDVWGGSWGAVWGSSWGVGDAPPEEDAPHHGHGDGGKRKTLHIFKPTGLVDRPVPRGRKTVEERLLDSRNVHAEVSGQIARKFEGPQEPRTQTPIAKMSLADVHREIGDLLHKKIRTEEDEMLILILMAACA